MTGKVRHIQHSLSFWHHMQSVHACMQQLERMVMMPAQHGLAKRVAAVMTTCRSSLAREMEMTPAEQPMPERL